ncbi:MAG: hypothetical protein HQM10_14640 [Candidatus Riflebacteria bacterium]|nr:hypothetical protein [Candidatus Riflebacteria bacterium]
MRKFRKKFSRDAVILVLITIAIFILFMTGAYLLKTSTLQRGQTNRLGEMNVASGVGYGLAQLALHKIMYDELANPSSSMVQALSLPLNSMTDFNLGTFNLESGSVSLKSVCDTLTEPLAKLGNFYYRVSVKFGKSDFQAIGLSNLYPREKLGLIHIFVDINHKKFNTSGPYITENYHYVAKIKVTAAIVPILSKFTLYVENANDGNPWRYNVATTDQDGHLAGTQVVPIVLNNAGEPTVPTTMSDFVKKPFGFVYLGGGPVYLNIARGWGANPDYGEGFHLFECGRGDGLYTVAWGQDNMAILQWDQGTCQPSSLAGNKDWFDFIAHHPMAEMVKFNSIFRLLGTDVKKSPTLVFGEVFRGFICAKAYKSSVKPPPFPPAFLPYIGNMSIWMSAVGGSAPLEGFPPIQPFFTRIDEFAALTSYAAHLKLYQEKYSSTIVASQPYNLSLAFIGTNNRNAFPRESHFRSGDPLLELTQANPQPPAAKMHDLPSDLTGLIPGVNSLKDMQPILDSMKIPGERVSWVIPASKNSDIIQTLKDYGLAHGASPLNLNCNGWVYVEGTSKLEISEGIKITGNGGIVLEKGEIVISAPINCDPASKKVLYLITRDGDIKVGADVNASLIAGKGKVLITGGKRKINGSVAMSRFDITNASHGAEISYDPTLGALPLPLQTSVPAASEAALLSFSICPDPVPIP